MFRRNIVWSLMVVLPLTRVATAWGEGEPADSLAEKAGLFQKITPAYANEIKGDASSVAMDNRFTNLLDFTNGLKMNTLIQVLEKRYRDQDREDNNKKLSHNVMMMVNPQLFISGSLSESRINNRIVSFTGALQDFIQNTRQATMRAEYNNAVAEGIKLSSWTNVRAANEERDFKVDKSLEGAIGAGLNYKFFEDRISATTRGFVKKGEGRAEAGSFEFKGLGLSEDSLTSNVSLQVTDSSTVAFEYIRFNSSLDRMDLPRGTFLQEDLDPDELNREREIRRSRVLGVKAEAKPFSSLKLQISARHSEDSRAFAVEKRRASETVSDILEGALSYTIAQNTTANVMLARKEILHLGPEIVSSFDELQQSFQASLRHSFTPTLSFFLQAGTSLGQLFFLDFENNPKDKDQLNQDLRLTISSKPFSKIDATIGVAITSIDYVNINGNLSSSNRREIAYDLRPNITYRLNDRIQIRQEYNLNIEFTDFDFTEDQNFLDRNIRFSNTVQARLLDALDVEFFYALHLHDGGSYLREGPGAERLLSIDSEDRKDATRIKFKYRVNDHLSVIGEHDYSRRVDRTVATGRETEFTDGGIKGGLEGTYNLGNGRSVDFALLKANRFGRFNTEAQNDFWEMWSRINYAF
ncbi:MAG: hypothetical protein GTO51_02850 [Candidatus Latescibacteria bacterium]|nr:hypothetical protein [Candidatus Latescibacterota bacterium]NIM64911.1 hypothetical protein [Candidatus Latescibacterota bacterium]NIO01426.1 hypothetical protein [Candidatus Latescibacterota bacterium]NIO27936.1 hypothetical protein [Candidatus Latescibacterota bacterium]NIO55487.1 hypothetical protein [Candidatus Latescibacterota bacterium]